ncbi:MAG: alpha-amylase [Gemmatales bacterium]|nr:MAG: alpha-amylase [Gemmatales bacterium]
MPLRFVFAVHNHQPVGNFEHVFEEAYRTGYLPFLDLIERYPDIGISLHTSGPLLEWLVEKKPDYIERVKGLVQRGQIEILGGGFYEPILPMIPSHDRIGQIRTYSAYLQELFGQPIRGMWIAERVWEPGLVRDLADAGIEFTVLDDYHFRQAGFDDEKLFGYFLSEDEGRLLRIFPGSEPMRYYIPFRNVEEGMAYFGEVAAKHPDAVVVFADDGEKFGSWPETYKHCYEDGWLPRFFDALMQARDWIQTTSFSKVIDETLPAGKAFLPDCSYREMTEWAMPAARLLAYNHLIASIEHDPRGNEIRRFLRGGFWRNFRVKYPEVDEMYARMLSVSRRCLEAENRHPEVVYSYARQELYRAQCNCAWWHGTFGGLYLPHLRNAVYQHLIAAESALLTDTERGPDYTHAATADFNLDARHEIRLENNRFCAFVDPHHGGSIYELDLRTIQHNLLATLSRRHEAYHEVILNRAELGRQQSIQGEVRFKQEGLDKALVYDAYLRKSLIDHFYDASVSLEDLTRCQERECGDFVTGEYEHRITRSKKQTLLTLTRSGRVDGQSIGVEKTLQVAPHSDVIEIRYVLTELPSEPKFVFAVEFNFAGMAAGADDRYFYTKDQPRAGQLQTQLALSDADLIGLVDEWLGLEVSLKLSKPGGFWTMPIQTVSQSEGGFELVHQCTAVLPYWHIEPDASGRWEVGITWKLDVSRAEQRKASSPKSELAKSR